LINFRDSRKNSLENSFNGLPLDTQLKHVEIVGLHVIIEKQNPNSIYERLNDVPFIETLEVYAETLEIKSALHLPQTNIRIFVKNLIFVDQENGPASISTVPLSVKTVPAQFANGVNGLRGGDISVFAQLVSNVDRGVTRFVLSGGDGQGAGAGQPAGPGASLPPLPTEVINGYVFVIGQGCTPPNPGDPNWANAIVYSETTPLGGPSRLGNHSWPGDGIAARPGGKPGEGGAGGDFRSNRDLHTVVDNSGGTPGQKAPDYLIPGPPGLPNPAYWAICGGSRGIYSTKHTQASGPPATSPSPLKAVGDNGKTDLIANPTAWLHPLNASVALRHAEDLYLLRYYKDAREIFENYSGYIQETLSSRNNDDADYSSNLQALGGRAERQRLQILNGLDFYGHPSGWVPLLSFEVYQTAYQQDVRDAARTFYLSYFLGTAMDKAESRARSLQAAIDNGHKEINQIIGQINSLRSNDIVALKSALVDIAQARDYFIQAAKLKDQYLIIQAGDNVDTKRRKDQEAVSLRQIGAFYLLTLSALGNPALGAALDSGFQAWANSVDPSGHSATFWDYLTKFGSLYSTGKEFESTTDQLRTDLDGLDYSSIDKLRDSLKGKKGDLLQSIGKLKNGIQQELDAVAKQRATDSDVQSELNVLRQSDNNYQELLQRAAELSEKETELINRLKETDQKLLELSDRLNQHTSTVLLYILSYQEALTGFDAQTRVAIEDMRRSAEQRLKYYRYLLAKAYEYRLLKPYDQQMLLEPLVEKMHELAIADKLALSDADLDDLMAPYYEQLRALTLIILEEFERHAESQISRTFLLDQSELDALNNGQDLVINVSDRKNFDVARETDRRIVIGAKAGVRVTALEQDGADDRNIDIFIQHSGRSTLHRAGELFRFEHIGYDGNSALVWHSIKNLNFNTLESSEPSAAAASLILSLLGAKTDKLLLFAYPGLDAPLTLSRRPTTGPHIQKLALTVTYTYVDSP
jgi:hypothetical protein